jgi:hypothetical protein
MLCITNIGYRFLQACRLRLRAGETPALRCIREVYSKNATNFTSFSETRGALNLKSTKS